MNSSDSDRPHYLSFLVRFWQASAPNGAQGDTQDSPRTWRGSVQPTMTEHITEFADMELLLAFLKAHIDQVARRKVLDEVLDEIRDDE